MAFTREVIHEGERRPPGGVVRPAEHVSCRRTVRGDQRARHGRVDQLDQLDRFERPGVRPNRRLDPRPGPDNLST